MFWTRAILWKIIKVLGYLIGMVRYYPARKKKYFFCPILDTSTHLQAHLLLQYGESGDESQDPAVSHGAFRHRCDHEHLHTPRIGRCQGRDDSYGGTERCESGTEQDHRRKACHPEDVPRSLIWKKIRGRSADRGGWQGVLLWRDIDGYGRMKGEQKYGDGKDGFYIYYSLNI